ncbi:MAG TPA: hypothetical protein VNK04_08870, partial [Gemmataceae bacterium]|nr:hypothetical protein [Gemmataceae bacterium]
MPPFSRRLASCWLLFFASLVVCPGAAAATPRNELLRLVPPDVGFCLVIEDLRGRSAAFFASDFARHFRESPLARALAQDPEVRKLLAFDQVLQKQLGISAARLRDDILGDAVVVAYRPGPPGKPEQEQGLFLVRARDARLLAELVQRLDQVQKESGELKEVEIRTYQGRTYHRRVERKGETYYYRSGPLLALSPQEAMLRQALACDLTAPADEEPPIACQLRRLGADRQLVAVWINPRAFTAEIEGKAGRAGAAEAAALNNFLTYWKALEGIALSAGAPQDFELRLSLRARTEELPAPARRLLAAAAQPASLWARFPDDALLAAAGRLDAEALLGVLDGFLTPATRRALYDSLDRTLGAALGRAGIKELLPHIGPEWGLCVTAPPAGSNWFPHAVLALQVRPGNPTDPVDQALLSALHSCAMLAV